MDFSYRHSFGSLASTILISSLLLIEGGPSSGPLPSTVDPCSPNPCQNRALCRPRGERFSCFCVPGFQGARCQIDVNECASQPCRDGATCVDRVGRFSCLCPPGFTGATCEIQIDECQSQPCLNGGRCHDHTDGFACICPPGFQGHQCQINTDECQGRPCRNGAPCVDGVNSYSCDCSRTAFTGRNCETPLPPCHSGPCLNSATCQDKQGNYTCQCWPGFEGRHCEIDINECGSNPCVHGGRCIERSWRALYGSEPLLPERYDRRRAAGYVCSCPPGTTGSLCQELIDHCDPDPCQNGGRCEALAGGYVCHCLKHGLLYGGPTCDQRLAGCDGHACHNQGSCIPSLLDGTHGYTCSCSPGYAGPLCETLTTFSFEGRGYLLLQSPLVDARAYCNVTLSFRSVLTRALLFQRRSRGLLLSLELDQGRLRLTLRRDADLGGPSQVLELPHNLTDGEWHSVETVLRSRVFSLKLLDDSAICSGQPCHKAAPVQNTPVSSAQPPQNTVIGGVLQQSAGPGEEAPAPSFIGCMRDVFVDRQLVVPEEWPKNAAVNVSPGCSRRDRCLDSPCKNGGRCINLWQSYRCRCPRPYQGPDCQEELVAARFGNEDSHGYAAFTVGEDPGPDLSVSLFLRTRRLDGFVLALGNGSGSGNVSDSDSGRYLHMWLEDGKVSVQLGGLEVLRSKGPINDGGVHFVSLEIKAGVMALHVGAQKQGEAMVGPVGLEAGHSVYVGGLARSRTTSAFGGYLKGCVQDLRVNERRLEFFRDASVRVMENVTAGCSGDDGCTGNPCLYGGTCLSAWDDFKCACPPKTAGRRCEEVRWCELSPCPAGSECRVLNQGYECYSNATFLNDSTVLTYRGNGQISRNLTSLSLNLRTRKRNAAVLHAERGSAFITVSVQDGFLFMELQSTAEWDGGEEEAVSTISLSSRSGVGDGEWHSVQLFMATPWTPTSRWTLVLDEKIEEASVSRNKGGNLDFLRQGVDIFVGGLAPEAGWALTGCLSTVELGGVALPYLGSSSVNLTRLQEEQFVQMSPRPPLLGCTGAPVCSSNPCLNGGECQDLFNTYSCGCADGWSGRRCDFFTDTCASGPCVHGNCSVKGPAYECACDFGFAGADCEDKADVCENHRCANGGTCLHGPDRYACLCPENFTGPLCSERVEEIPWYIVLRKVRPKLPVSVCGDETRNYTCFNGGNCTDRELSCDCPPGFTGHRCEQELDECKSNPCQNGGYCHNLINKFVCVCDMSYAGDVCQTDLTSVGLTSDLLLSVSLISVLVLVVLVLTSAGLMAALGRRATRGTYSPSRQEKDGSRVEMWSIAHTPPTERLI